MLWSMKQSRTYTNMTDFAASLGLSRSTVSYILNDKWKERNISPETVERVRRHAEATGFAPNFLGRMINGKVATDAAILLSDRLYHHHRQAFFQIVSMLAEERLRYMVFPVGSRETNRETLQRLRDFRVRSALLFVPPTFAGREDLDWWHRAISAMPDVRFLLYDCRFGVPKLERDWPEHVTLTGFDCRVAAAKMLAHIAACGYREAYDGFWIAEEFGVSHPGLRLLPRSQEEIMAMLAGPRPKRRRAVIIPDDLTTAAAIRTVLRSGMRVPEDYAFVSWDGLAFSDLFTCSLTTLEIPHTGMLECALKFLRGEDCGRVHVLEPRLRIGDSMPLPEKK